MESDTTPPPSPRWEVLPPRREEAEALGRAVGISWITAHVLLNRGIQTPEAARSFLQPSLNDLADPTLLPDCEAAADRLQSALTAGGKVAIFGDYDVDGLCGAALMASLVRLGGADPLVWIPDRQDGYGLREEAVERIAAGGARLLVTVDTGTTAHGPIQRARELGMEVVVTDHHEPGASLPEGTLVVNPKREDSVHPCRDLAGSGVAFLLAWHTARRLCGSDRVSRPFRDLLKTSLALVALGTVADVMPLLQDNRVLTRFGLEEASAGRHPGIAALVQSANLRRPITPTHVAFQIAPRLNAAGRMGCARLAYDLLTCQVPEEAARMAAELERINQDRREQERRATEEATRRVDEDPALRSAPALVLADPGWHPGVLGIVAARLTDRYCRPSVVVRMEGERGRGSCRSVPGFPLHQVLEECADHLRAYGGHALAAGLELDAGCLDPFRRAFEEVARRRLADRPASRVVTAQAVVPLEDLQNGAVVRELTRLAPFGQANPRPYFLAPGVSVAGKPRRMGRSGDHLSFLARQGRHTLRAVAFGSGERAQELERNSPWDLLVSPRINEWNGRTSVELEVKALRPA